jgi:hypothetical protein
MKVLLDACVPRPLRNFLTAHAVKTAQEMGWGTLKNGALLQAAEPEFDAFVASDQNLKYQQNSAGRNPAILVLPTNDWPTLRRMGGKIAAKVATLKPATLPRCLWNKTSGRPQCDVLVRRDGGVHGTSKRLT